MSVIRESAEAVAESPLWMLAVSIVVAVGVVIMIAMMLVAIAQEMLMSLTFAAFMLSPFALALVLRTAARRMTRSEVAS
jgi:hypothetical protein